MGHPSAHLQFGQPVATHGQNLILLDSRDLITFPFPIPFHFLLLRFERRVHAKGINGVMRKLFPESLNRSSVGLLIVGLSLCALCGCITMNSDVARNDRFGEGNASGPGRSSRRSPIEFPAVDEGRPDSDSGSLHRSDIVKSQYAASQGSSIATLHSLSKTASFTERSISHADLSNPISNPVRSQVTVGIRDHSTAKVVSREHSSLEKTRESTLESESTVQQTNESATSIRTNLDQLILELESEAASIPRNANSQQQADHRRKQIYLRLLYLMAQHPEQAVTAIPSLTPSEQEYWQSVLWAITNSLDVEGTLPPEERASQTLPPLNTALRRIREQADLSIKNAGFCEEVSYFGNYKRFPRDEFVPGQSILLYAEIENYRSEPTPTGEYRTLLRSVIEIQDDAGQIRWNKTFDATEDLCRNPRRDYFHNYQFTIPESLRLGSYAMKLTVVDELSRKQATSIIRFEVK